ncbi:MAG: hypothetical protein GY696_32640, partial [Gammaproteobacteria bacterium]|nr:hypothetical protein [Gammaproteobacteria bacterium]
MALSGEQVGTPLTSMPEVSDDLSASLPRTEDGVLLQELLAERRALKASNAQSVGNSATVGAPPAAAKQSLLLESPSGSARPVVDLSLDSSSLESRLMNLKFPFSLPIFAGTGREDFRKWIGLFDRAMLACGNLSGRERLRYLGVFLEGTAYRVLRGCGVDATYDSVVAALKVKFLSPEESRFAAVKFLGRIQEGTETIFEYEHILSELIETAYPSVPREHLDGLLRDRFLSGVLPRYQEWLRF